MSHTPPRIPPIFKILKSLIVGVLRNSRIAAVSPTTPRNIKKPRASTNTRPIKVSIVMRMDLIQPRALQRVIKKNTPTTTPATIAFIGDKNNDAIQTATSVIAAATRVLIILLKSDTCSSFLSAKNTNKILNAPKRLARISVQNDVFDHVSCVV